MRTFLTASAPLLLLLVGVAIGMMIDREIPDATVAAFFAVFVAAAAVLWEVVRDQREKRSHDALASAHAYLLHRELARWVDPPWPSDAEQLLWRITGIWRTSSFDQVESDIVSLVSIGARGSVNTNVAVRDAFIYLTHAREAINALGLSPPERKYDPVKGTSEPLVVPASVSESWFGIQRDLKRCINALQRIIDERLREDI